MPSTGSVSKRRTHFPARSPVASRPCTEAAEMAGNRDFALGQFIDLGILHMPRRRSNRTMRPAAVPTIWTSSSVASEETVGAAQLQR